MEQKKRGRRPLKQQKQSLAELASEVNFDITSISPELKAELDKKGLAYRWTDYPKMVKFAGYHPRGWQLYKRSPDDIMDTQESRLGRDPDGLVRRGTLVLVVKPKEANDKYKRYLEARSSQYVVKSREQQVEDLRRRAKDSNLDTKIVEGYDDN